MIVHTIIYLNLAVASTAVYFISELMNTFRPSTHAPFVLVTADDATRSEQDGSEYVLYSTDDDVAVGIRYSLTPMRTQTFRAVTDV